MDKLLLFDIDGTLTLPRKVITSDMKEMLTKLKNNKYLLGIVSGSDLKKIIEQLGSTVLQEFDYVFAENGLVAYKNNRLIGIKSIIDHLGNSNYKKFVNYCLKYLSEIDLPIKRGTFIELRNGMVNISPVGRNCSQKERDNFEIYDKKENVRQKMIDSLKDHFSKLKLKFSIGGQISFDVFPEGFDKSYCLKYLIDLKEIHFFGDKTDQGGNDYEIFINKKVIGHKVSDYHDTIHLLKRLFLPSS
jgi:phosphomannomutase